MFLDAPQAKPAMRFTWSSLAKSSAGYPLPAPDVQESEATPTFRLLALDALVRMKLTSYRDKDRTHLRDLIDVGLLDATWLQRLPPELSPRLQQLLDTPDG